MLNIALKKKHNPVHMHESKNVDLDYIAQNAIKLPSR